MGNIGANGLRLAFDSPLLRVTMGGGEGVAQSAHNLLGIARSQSLTAANIADLKPGQQLALQLQDARYQFMTAVDVLRGARSMPAGGGTSAEQAATFLEGSVGALRSVSGIAADSRMAPSVRGAANRASTQIERAAQQLRAVGAASVPEPDQALFSALDDARFHLDEARDELGRDYVMGRLLT